MLLVKKQKLQESIFNYSSMLISDEIKNIELYYQNLTNKITLKKDTISRYVITYFDGTKIELFIEVKNNYFEVKVIKQDSLFNEFRTNIKEFYVKHTSQQLKELENYLNSIS